VIRRLMRVWWPGITVRGAQRNRAYLVLDWLDTWLWVRRTMLEHDLRELIRRNVGN
jgi:hypothetical protein